MADRLSYPMMIGTCPRCGQVKSTFDILGSSLIDPANDIYEVFARCRQCFRPSVAEVHNRVSRKTPAAYEGQFIHPDFEFRDWVVVVPHARNCPDHVPPEVSGIFNEAAACEASALWDAAGVMYRKVLDVATRVRTPVPAENDPMTPQWKVYKDLRLRLDWLFERGLLDASLQDLSSCIHQDGNDAAHDEAGIGRAEATDLGDFSELVLKTIYTLPGQIAENQRRRKERRDPTG